MRLKRFLISSLILLHFILPLSAKAEERFRLYYLSVETTLVNGIAAGSEFMMSPVDSEYRIEKFEKIAYSGNSSGTAYEDAVNDALSKLVADKGLKSVSSSQRLVDGVMTDVAIMKHEGVLKFPYKASTAAKCPEGMTCVDIEAEFSAFSMPSEWGWQRFKKSVSNCFADVLSVFRQIWD